jgi:hypothetical protein
MRFLLDNNLSRSWPNFSAAQGRVLISADTDFGTLLARTHATAPSFLLLRRARGRRASEQAAIILSTSTQSELIWTRAPSWFSARRRYASAGSHRGPLARAGSRRSLFGPSFRTDAQMDSYGAVNHTLMAPCVAAGAVRRGVGESGK